MRTILIALGLLMAGALGCGGDEEPQEPQEPGLETTGDEAEEQIEVEDEVEIEDEAFE